ncbi:MAG TPA: triose-phosphate isomerase [Casimicrobiaceae bacterium]|nr:triose-phosphate isomerase [Casimicrobiaceae bacterium]
MRGKLVVGNWKMNGGLRQNDALLADLRSGWTAMPSRRIAICVPFPYLWQAQAALSGSVLAWGAQNVSEHGSGAFTGEVAATMVAEFGSRVAIVGHSERRTLYGETDAAVANKAAAALAAGLTPIVCVGETLAEREASATDAVVLRQLDAVVAVLGEKLAQAVVAYEPVWAIGTGRTASPQQAEAVHALLRRRLRTAVGEAADEMLLLYGGSVKADNAKTLFACANIDGGLVGGASLKADEFLAIARA